MVRLVDTGSYDFEGRVEACVNGGWGTICSSFWDTTDAGVLCRQLNVSTSGICMSHLVLDGLQWFAQ